MIDKLHSSDIQLNQMVDENGVTRNMIDELRSTDLQGDQMEGEEGFT